MRVKRLRPPIDMCNGPIIPQLLRFSLPVILTSVVQLLFNAVDLVVIGNFAGDTALAAVGANSSLVSLLLNLIIGLSIGTNVTIAQALGAQDNVRARSLSHTAVLLGAVCGISLAIITIVGAPVMLGWMETPDTVLGGAVTYLRVIACGFPFNLLYNFSASILRACGDTRRPLNFLLIAGSVKVVSSILFVSVFHWGVAGVAFASVLSHLLSVVLVINALRHMHNPCRLHRKDLKIRWQDTKHILKIGLPAGIQSCCFSLANVVIQSSINSFGEIAIAGNTAGADLENFIFASIDAIAQACLTFVGQNLGAKKYERISRVVRAAILIGVIITVVLCALSMLFLTPILSIYTSNPAAIEVGAMRTYVVCTLYFLVPVLYVISYSIRAMGYSLAPMITCVVGVCGVRLLFVFTILKKFHYLQTLFASFPISWLVTVIALWIVYRITYRKVVGNALKNTVE